MSEEKKYPSLVAAAFILNKKGEVFLVRAPHWSNKLVIPGGHIEMGESAEETTVREIKEETNLERYRKYKGKSPLELWRQRHSKKHHSNQRIKQDIEPLNNHLFQETPIYHQPKKFHIQFQINH